MRVVKRDGEKVDFNVDRIVNAIFKALSATGLPSMSVAQKVSQDVVERLPRAGEQEEVCVSVETIQDEVEKAMMKRGLYDAAKAYILYRDKRAEARAALKVRNRTKSKQSVTDKNMMVVQSMTSNEVSQWDRGKIIKILQDTLHMDSKAAHEVARAVEKTLLNSGISPINSSLIRETVNTVLANKGYNEQLRDLSMYQVPRDYIEDLMHTKVKENSNIVHNNPEAVSLSIADLVLKQYALDAVFSPEVAMAHANGRIYLHDNGFPHRTYCSSHSIEYIKKYGLKGLVNLNTESKPAKSASVLTGHLNTFLASMQANYAGALGLGFVNVFYAPMLVGMDKKQLHQTAQELIFNSSQNAFSRGCQVLFTDVNVCTGVPCYLKDVPAIGPGGKYMWRDKDGNMHEAIDRTDDDGWCIVADGWTVLREIDGKFVEQEPGHVMRYGDYEQETRDFAHAMLDVWAEGDARGRVFEFPKCDFHVSLETFTDPEQYKVYEHACELAACNGSTYFVFDRDSVSLASCCFTGDTRVIQVKDNGEVIGMELSKLYEQYPDKTITTLNERREPVKAIVRRFDGSTKAIIRAVFADGSMLRMTEDHDVPLAGGWSKKAVDLCKGDVLMHDASFDMIADRFMVRDIMIEEPMLCVYCLEMEDQDHPWFLLDNMIVTHNCRLRVQITDMSIVKHPERLRTCGLMNVTINIPQAAYRARHATEHDDEVWGEFLHEIDISMDLAVQAELQKKAHLETLMQRGGPLWQLGKPANDGQPYLRLEDATYIIGLIGVNDALNYLYGKEMHESEEVMDKALEVIAHMYLRCKEYTKEHGLTFKLEESPAESAARKLAKADLVYWRDDALKVYKGGSEDYAYYTNSIHLSADAPVGLLDRIDAQARFNSMIEAGAITHAFIGEERPDPKVIAKLIEKAFLRTQSAQIVFSPEFTYCNACGKNDTGLHDKCRFCDSEDVEGITRIVGYYSAIKGWNLSKLAELRARQHGPYAVQQEQEG